MEKSLTFQNGMFYDGVQDGSIMSNRPTQIETLMFFCKMGTLLFNDLLSQITPAQTILDTNKPQIIPQAGLIRMINSPGPMVDLILEQNYLGVEVLGLPYGCLVKAFQALVGQIVERSI